MAIDQITTGVIKNDAVTAAKIVAGAVVADVGAGGIGTTQLAADAVDGTKLADNAVNSEHYTDGSIDLAHLSADSVDGTKIVDDAINSEHYAAGSIDTAHIGDDQVTGAKIENNPTIAGNLTVSGDLVPSSPLSHRNIIINGDMGIAQRGGSHASVGGTTKTYSLDRWAYMFGYGTPAQRMTLSRQQDSASLSTAGFRNSFKVDCTTVESNLGANTSRYSGITQLIECQNLHHLLYGTSDAKTLTLSFWVKSSRTGTHGIGIMINNGGAALPQSYSVSTADTWEYKQVTIAGNTSAAIGTTEYGMGIVFLLNLGTAQLSGTQNTWGTKLGHTAVANLMGNTSYDFYITGVQLEVGSNATPFEHRSYNEELIRCQRYCAVFGDGSTGCSGWITGGASNHAASGYFQYRLPALPRAIPTFAISGQFIITDNHTADHVFTSPSIGTQPQTAGIQGRVYLGSMSGLTVNRVYSGPNGVGGTGRTTFSAEL